LEKRRSKEKEGGRGWLRKEGRGGNIEALLLPIRCEALPKFLLNQGRLAHDMITLQM